jgi:hypothetical protein
MLKSTEIRRQIREHKADMKARGFRIIGFMNRQPVDQSRANCRLYELKLALDAALKTERQP